jgi:colanic acid/amylovoran biosynthesis glycosyltransferase
MSAHSQGRPTAPPVAYLCSAYPTVSHTFVLREVLALRRLGVDVHPFTVHRSPPESLLSELDRDEAARTHHLLPATARQLLAAFARLLVTRRGAAALSAGAREAWTLRRPGARAALWQGFYLAEAVLLWAECSRRSIRHVHAHFANVASDVALLTATLGTARDPGHPWSWSWTMHGPSDFWNVRDRKLAEKAEKARFVACISDFARSQLMGLTHPSQWDRLHVVHCGIDPSTYGRGELSDRPPADGLRLVTVGRLAPVKGQVQIVDAVHALRERGLEVSAEIVGEGPSRPDIEQRIGELGLAGIVTLPGALGQDRVPARLRAATVFLLPSFAEGVPVVVMEAMAVGTPVVTSRVSGIPELVEDGVSGLLTTPSRIDELVAALERLLRDPELRARLAAAGRVKVAAEFDVNDQARRLVRLFPGQETLATLPPMSGPDPDGPLA